MSAPENGGLVWASFSPPPPVGRDAETPVRKQRPCPGASGQDPAPRPFPQSHEESQQLQSAQGPETDNGGEWCAQRPPFFSGRRTDATVSAEWVVWRDAHSLLGTPLGRPETRHNQTAQPCGRRRLSVRLRADLQAGAKRKTLRIQPC